MKRLLFVLPILFLIVGCSGPLTSSGPGSLVTTTTEGISANNNVEITKTGKSCQHTVLGLVAFGDSSIESAKRNGNLTNISTVDRSFFGILGLYSNSCLILQGN